MSINKIKKKSGGQTKLIKRDEVIIFRTTKDFKERLMESAINKNLPVSTLISLWLSERLEQEKNKN